MSSTIVTAIFMTMLMRGKLNALKAFFTFHVLGDSHKMVLSAENLRTCIFEKYYPFYSVYVGIFVVSFNFATKMDLFEWKEK